MTDPTQLVLSLLLQFRSQGKQKELIEALIRKIRKAVAQRDYEEMEARQR